MLRQTRAGEMLTLLEDKEETSLLLAIEIPAALGGRIRANVANALAAAAVAVARDVQLECIRDALRAFTTDFAQTPGRFNLLDVAGRQVVMDYAHNVAALEAIADFVKRTAAPRSIGVITVPGDRRDEDARAFGLLAGQIFDEVVIREDENPRGRARGEMAALLRQAVLDAGLPANRSPHRDRRGRGRTRWRRSGCARRSRRRAGRPRHAGLGGAGAAGRAGGKPTGRRLQRA